MLRPGLLLVIPPVDGVYHTVFEGDILEAIAERYGVEVHALYNQWNDIDSGIPLMVGEILFIPGGRGPEISWTPSPEPPFPSTDEHDRYRGSLAPAGSFPAWPSWCGAMNVSGNVWEWVSDWYHVGYYQGSPSQNPQGSEPEVYQVVRGGWEQLDVPSWPDSSISDRVWTLPSSSSYNLGFRCAADATWPAGTADMEVLTGTPTSFPGTLLLTCLDASYVADITIPDNTQLDSGETFVKTWRVRNTGTCPWPEDAVLAFVSGTQMGTSASTLVGAVEPGEEIEISVEMRSPSEPGQHTGVWRMRGPEGFFGSDLSVVIQVRE